MKLEPSSTRTAFRRGMNLLHGNQSQTAGMTDLEAKFFREELVKTLYSLRSTQDIIKANSSLLQIDMKDNKAIQDALRSIGDANIGKTIDRIMAKKDISNREAKGLIEYMDRFTKSMEAIDASLEIRLPEILDNLESVVKDDTLSVGYRKEYLANVQKLLTSSEIAGQVGKDTAKSIKKIEALNKSTLNFTKDEQRDMALLLEDMKKDTKDVRIHQTLKQLDKNINSSVLLNGELKDTLKKTGATNSSLQEAFEKAGGNIARGVGGNRTGMIKGAMSLVSPQMAELLGGPLDDLAGTLIEGWIGGKAMKGGMGKGIGKVFGKAKGFLGGTKSVDNVARYSNLFGDAAGAVGGASKLGGGILGAGAKIVGKAAVPLAVGLGAYEGLSNENEITGGKKGKRLASGLSGIASALTLGLITPKQFYDFTSGGNKSEQPSSQDTRETIQKAKTKADESFGFVGQIAKKTDEMVNRLTGGNTDFTENMASRAMDSIKSLFNFIIGAGNAAGQFAKDVAIKAGVAGQFAKDVITRTRGAIDRTGMTGGVTTATGKEKVGASEKAKYAMNYMMEKGLSRKEAAAVTGNLIVESGNFRDDVIAGTNKNKDHGSIGVAQWRGPRVAKFKEVMGRDLQGAPLEQQLDFLMWEMKNTHKAGAENVRNAKDVGSASAAFDKYIEISDGSARQKRVNYSTDLYNDTGEIVKSGKKVVPTAPVASSPVKSKKKVATALSGKSVTPNGEIVMVKDSKTGQVVSTVQPRGTVSSNSVEPEVNPAFGIARTPVAPDVKSGSSTELAALATKKETRKKQAQQSQQAQNNISIAQPSQSAGGTNGRRLQIDDYGLAIANSLLFG